MLMREKNSQKTFLQFFLVVFVGGVTKTKQQARKLPKFKYYKKRKQNYGLLKILHTSILLVPAETDFSLNI